MDRIPQSVQDLERRVGLTPVTERTVVRCGGETLVINPPTGSVCSDCVVVSEGVTDGSDPAE